MFYNFLTPTDIQSLDNFKFFNDNHLVKNVFFLDGDIIDFSQCDCAIVGIDLDSNQDENNLIYQPIRNELYHLYAGEINCRILDLGNIQYNENIQVMQDHLSLIIADFTDQNIPVIILSDSQQFTFGQYRGYERAEKMVRMVNIDERIDIRQHERSQLKHNSYLLDILNYEPNYLQYYTHLGYQTYYVNPKELEILEKLHFDSVRLGELRSNLKEIEPFLRDADLLSFDLSAIKYADAIAKRNQTPNGFTSEEACQIMRYAGLSDTITSIGVYEYESTLDIHRQTAKLIAQMIWYFIEGYSIRKVERVDRDGHDFVKYIVNIEEYETDFSFWKSKKTDRWWMEIAPELRDRFGNAHFIPCSYSDYLLAMNNDLPDKWMKVYKKA